MVLEGDTVRPWMSFDVETSGVLPEYALQPWRVQQRKAWITTAAFTVREPNGALKSRGQVYPDRPDLRAILEYAIVTGSRVVTWNGIFDMAWLIAYGLGDLVQKVLWLDAMRMWKHVDLTSSFTTADHTYSLKGERGALSVFLPYRVGREENVEYHSPDPAELAKLLAYNKDDTDDTLVVAEEIWKLLTPKQRGVVLVEAKCFPMVAHANWEGMLVDKAQVKAVNTRMLAQAEEMKGKLAEFGVTETIVRSPKQLSKLLFDDLGLPDIGGGSTSKDVLSELAIDDERAAQVTKFREALNLRSKFVGGMVASVDYNEDGQTRPQANPLGTYTSRFTYASTQDKRARADDASGAKATGKNRLQIGFALHQMKRDKEFKDMVIAPFGYDIVEADAAGQEFRWAAIQSGDETMLELCMPGEDAHSFMGAQIARLEYVELRARVKAGEDLAGKIRQGGKVGNLSLQYRTYPKTFRIRARADHNLIISKQEAEHIWRTYQRAYPGMPKYWERQIALGRKLGYAETMAGRRVKVVGNWGGASAWAMESTMINYPVQGTGGDQKYLAMSVLKDELPKYDARFAWDLHDGIYFYVPKDKSHAFAEKIKQLLPKLPYEKAWGFKSPIPLPWDVKVGPSWGSLKELH